MNENKQYLSHEYPDFNGFRTVSCIHRCGCWINIERKAGGPVGLKDNPYGECPHRPKNGKRLGLDKDWELIVTKKIGNLTKDAGTNPVTGLPNGRSLKKNRRGKSRRKETTEHGSILFLDLDRFKYLNDTFGHAIGNQALKWFSRFLMEHVRIDDVVCHIGGDEFLVFLRGANTKEARRIKSMLLKNLREKTFRGRDPKGKYSNAAFIISATIGIAKTDYFPNEDATDRADKDMQRQKKKKGVAR